MIPHFRFKLILVLADSLDSFISFHHPLHHLRLGFNPYPTRRSFVYKSQKQSWCVSFIHFFIFTLLPVPYSSLLPLFFPLSFIDSLKLAGRGGMSADYKLCGFSSE